ncbi:MAG: hypothetical protein Fur003_1670 [Candidatus Dojkabacteria bacterium]
MWSGWIETFGWQLYKWETKLKAANAYLLEVPIIAATLAYSYATVVFYNRLDKFWILLLLIPLFFIKKRFVKGIAYVLITLAFAALACYRVETIIQKRERLQALTENLIDKEVQMIGVVVDEPQIKPDRKRITLKVSNLSEEPFLIQGNLSSFAKVNYGDKCEIKGSLEKPKAFDDFDYAKWLEDQQILYTFRPVGYNCIDSSRYEAAPLVKGRAALVSLKQIFIKKINYEMPEPQASLLAGILLGDKRYFQQEFAEGLRLSGTTHIVAASGYNISIILVAVDKLFGRIKRKNRLVLSLIFAWCFTILSGLSISILRAAVMATLVIIGRLGGGVVKTHIVLALMIAIFALINPGYLNQVSFQLSLLSVMGLFYLHPAVVHFFDISTHRIKLFAKAKPFIEEYFMTTLATMLATLPVIVSNFKQLALGGIIANLLILPVLESSMILGLVGGISAFIWPSLSRLFFFVLWVQLKYFEGVVWIVARFKALVINFENLISLNFILALFVILTLLFILTFYPKEGQSNYYLKLFKE